MEYLFNEPVLFTNRNIMTIGSVKMTIVGIGTIIEGLDVLFVEKINPKNLFFGVIEDGWAICRSNGFLKSGASLKPT